MRVPLACYVFVVLAGCETSDFATEFAVAARDLPADGKVMLEFSDGEITRYVASVDPSTVPAAARRTAQEIVQPGGETVFVGREWSADAIGYRFVKAYGNGGSFRTVLVDAAGTVLGRSHRIRVEDGPAEARAAVEPLAGTIQWLEVVQRERGSDDVYRFGLVDDDGKRWFAITDAAGHILERGREADARVFFGTR